MKSDAEVFDAFIASQGLGTRVTEHTVGQQVWNRSYGHFTGMANALFANAGKLVQKQMLPIYFAFVKNPRINAWAWRSEGRYLIGFNSGAYYMLELIFSRMLADPRLFGFIPNPTLEQTGIPPLVYDRIDAEKTYQSGMRPIIPRSVERIAYMGELMHWAFHFLLCHELAHITLGHVDYFLANETAVLSELSWNLPTNEADLERQAIEAEADQRAVMSAIPSLQLSYEARQAMKPSTGNLRTSVTEMLFDWSFAINAFFRLFGDSGVEGEEVSKSNYPPIPLRRFMAVFFADTWVKHVWKPPENNETTLKAIKEGAEYTEMAFRTIMNDNSSGKGLDVFGPLGIEYTGQIAKYVQTELAKKIAPYAYERPQFMISEAGVTTL